MPGRNATGPMGRGPLTGRGLGICVGSGEVRLGLGRRIGRRCGYGEEAIREATDGSDATSQEALLEQKRVLQHRLETINKELGKL